MNATYEHSTENLKIQINLNETDGAHECPCRGGWILRDHHGVSKDWGFSNIRIHFSSIKEQGDALLMFRTGFHYKLTKHKLGANIFIYLFITIFLVFSDQLANFHIFIYLFRTNVLVFSDQLGIFVKLLK